MSDGYIRETYTDETNAEIYPNYPTVTKLEKLHAAFKLTLKHECKKAEDRGYQRGYHQGLIAATEAFRKAKTAGAK